MRHGTHSDHWLAAAKTLRTTSVISLLCSGAMQLAGFLYFQFSSSEIPAERAVTQIDGAYVYCYRFVRFGYCREVVAVDISTEVSPLAIRYQEGWPVTDPERALLATAAQAKSLIRSLDSRVWTIPAQPASFRDAIHRWRERRSGSERTFGMSFEGFGWPLSYLEAGVQIAGPRSTLMDLDFNPLGSPTASIIDGGLILGGSAGSDWKIHRLILNVLLIALPLTACAALYLLVQRAARIWNRCCPSCGYSRNGQGGVDLVSACPECGNRLRSLTKRHP